MANTKQAPRSRQTISIELLERAKAERDRRLELRGLHASAVARYASRGPEKAQIEALLETLDRRGEDGGMLAHLLRERLHEVIRDLARAEIWGRDDAGNVGEVIAGAALRTMGSNAQLTRARASEGPVETLWRVLIEMGCTAEQIGALAERDGHRNHDGAARRRAARWIARLRDELLEARTRLDSSHYITAIDEILSRLISGTSDG